MSWRIGNTNKMLVVMYSVPYDHNLYSNWCGVGIFDFVADTSGYFDMMYNNTERGFKRKDFWSNLDPLTYKEDSMFVVQATMDNNHKPDIKVRH